MRKVERIVVGVVGAGGMGSMHAEILHTSVVDARLAAVSDLDAGRAAQIAERCGSAAVFTDAWDEYASLAVADACIASLRSGSPEKVAKREVPALYGRGVELAR